jgi:hypothetical protein
MRWILSIFLLNIFSSGFSLSRDTLPNWNFYYNKKIVMEGSSDDFFTPKHANIKIGDRSPGRLVATFNYNIEATFNSTLEIRRGTQVIKTLEYSGNPSGSGFAPSVKNGSVFVIPLDELTDQQSEGRVSLDFYYADSRIRPTLVGSIDVIIQPNE